MNGHATDGDDFKISNSSTMGKSSQPPNDKNSGSCQADISAMSINDILQAIPGENPDREGLKNTPQRFARAFAELTSGYKKNIDDEVGDALFGEAHNGIVLQTDIPIYSLCEHHLLPFFGHVHVAYIPNPEVGIMGLSKFKRSIEIFAKRLQVQERLTNEIASSLDYILKPLGLAVIISCRHMCMEMRGIGCHGTITTTVHRRGVLNEPGAFQELWSIVHAGQMNQQSESVIINGLNLKASCFPENLVAGNELLDSKIKISTDVKCSVQNPYKSNDSDNYRLYLSCLENEVQRIAKTVEEAVMGPLSKNNPQGISILDVGAGNGAVLKALHNSPGIKMSRYVAYEMDANLCNELHSMVISLGYNEKTARIFQSQFNVQTTAEEFGGIVDLVLLSHCLYGQSLEEKIKIVEHSLKLISNGGVLLIFHRWERDGTLNSISQFLSSKSLLHNLCVWESCLCLSSLDLEQRIRLQHYTKGSILEENQSSAVRLIGCISIEPYCCNSNSEVEVDSFLVEARKQVSFLASKKNPSTVVKPNTIVGIQASLQAAALKKIGSGNVTVIGGGHSENAFAENAIAINMQLWNNVEIDQDRRLVKIGGGAKNGEVIKKCEKHGLFVPLGDRPGVGAGLLLHGGLNHFMRKFGIAADNIVKIIYVNPDGRVKEAVTDEELFQFRGAGSNFGVILEFTVKAYLIDSIKAQDILYALPKESYQQVLTEYSEIADSLPDTSCLDGFLFWSGAGQLAFATSHFDIDPETNLAATSTKCLLLPFQKFAEVREETCNSPYDLYHRELYMTSVFASNDVMASGHETPKKLKSNKRCLFLPLLTQKHESIFLKVMRSAPTKWCYIHIMHGGKAVSNVEPAKTAFGHRDWIFAAVITARWSDCNVHEEILASRWLKHALSLLLPYSKGVYGSDLGLEDNGLARQAFGLNARRLAKLKQECDPLNILGCACPISADEDPRVQGRGVVIIFSGRRCSGKDWLASLVHSTLDKMIGGLIKLASISDDVKKEFTKENPLVDYSKLSSNRSYKDSHRKALTDFYHRKCAQDLAYDAKCFLKAVQSCDDGSILLLTGVRNGLEYVRRLAGKPVVLIKIVSCDKARQARGWSYDCDIDKSQGEFSADVHDESFWDLVYVNNFESNAHLAEEWTKDILVPCIFKRCTRSLQDTPKVGVQYRDIFGSLLLQPFAMSLWAASVLGWVEKNGQGLSIDAIVAPEAAGFAFASPIAAFLKKPLILMRKIRKLKGAVDRVRYNGSNLHEMMNQGNTQCQTDGIADDNAKCCLEVQCGAIVPGQRILVVDDCLAGGSTLRAVLDLVHRQGGMVTKLAVLLEFPDLSGRPDKQIEMFSLVKFPGK